METFKLIFSPKVTPEGHQPFTELYEMFHKSYPGVQQMVESMTPDANKITLDFSQIYKANHACAWNKPKHIGREVYIAAQSTDKLFAIILFADDFKAQVYRAEDLSVKDGIYDQMVLQS